jgi:parallel beta-helix repeat protein
MSTPWWREITSAQTQNAVDNNYIENSGVFGILGVVADQNSVAGNVFSGNVVGDEYFVG